MSITAFVTFIPVESSYIHSLRGTYATLERYFADNGAMPTTKQLAALVNLSELVTFRRLVDMHRRGWIEREAGVMVLRGIR